MKQLILTVFISFAVLMAQAQVRDSVSGQSDSRIKAQTAAEQDKEISIYPNPNNGVFTISFAQLDAKQVDLRIINVIGNEIHHEVISQSDIHSSKTVDLTKFAKGLYYVKIETENYSSVRRVVVK